MDCADYPSRSSGLTPDSRVRHGLICEWSGSSGGVRAIWNRVRMASGSDGGAFVHPKWLPDRASAGLFSGLVSIDALVSWQLLCTHGSACSQFCLHCKGLQ